LKERVPPHRFQHTLMAILSFCSRLVSILNPLRQPNINGAHSEASRAQERQRRVLLTSLSFALYRGLALLFPILTIGLFIRGLGKEAYGFWMTATSFFALFSFADLGLGFGLLTRLSQSIGQRDLIQSRRLISSAFFMLAGISGILLVIVVAVFLYVPWGILLDTASLATRGVAIGIAWSVVLAQLLQIPLSLVQRAQLALQEGYKSNLWQCAGVLINLLVVFLLVRVHAHPLLLVASACLIPVLAILMNWIYFFGFDSSYLRPSWTHMDASLARSLLRMGGGFFLLQVLLGLGLSLDNLVVAKVCGLGEVADFAVASRVAAVIGGVVSMLSMPLWAANGDAFARGDLLWIRRSCIKASALSLALALCASLMLVAFGPWVFEKWLGKDLNLGRSLLASCALRETLLAVAAPFFMVMNAAGLVWPQIRVFLVFTVLVTLLKIILTKIMGSQGAALGNAALYSVWVFPWVIRQARSTWRGEKLNQEG
jgi:O-antigen/teichoic acid export membrane protein